MPLPTIQPLEVPLISTIGFCWIVLPLKAAYFHFFQRPNMSGPAAFGLVSLASLVSASVQVVILMAMNFCAIAYNASPAVEVAHCVAAFGMTFLVNWGVEYWVIRGFRSLYPFKDLRLAIGMANLLGLAIPGTFLAIVALCSFWT